jgi:hypothetical protein
MLTNSPVTGAGGWKLVVFRSTKFRAVNVGVNSCPIGLKDGILSNMKGVNPSFR